VPGIDASEIADVERKLELIRHDRESQRAVARMFLNHLGHRKSDCHHDAPRECTAAHDEPRECTAAHDERLPFRRAVFTLSHYLALLHSPGVI